MILPNHAGECLLNHDSPAYRQAGSSPLKNKK
jgi:hypothetical protein